MLMSQYFADPHITLDLVSLNPHCFFLVDYGQSQNDDMFLCLSYEWTGNLRKIPLNLIISLFT